MTFFPRRQNRARMSVSLPEIVRSLPILMGLVGALPIGRRGTMCELEPERVGAPLLPRAGILDTRHSAHAGSGRFQAAPAQTMLQILSHTPRWVFALFAALLAFGLLQTKSRKVNATLAYVLPAGMVVLSLSGIQSSFGFRPSPLAAWAVGLTATAVIGYKVFPNKRILFNSETATFYVPVSWAPLAVIIA